MVFGDKNSDLCLLHKIKSFDLKHIRSVFQELKKWFFFFFNKRSDLFYDNKKIVFDNRKIRSVFYMF